MDGFLIAFAISFGVIFVAELGDKSQLMALTFATRFNAVPVLIGITIATSVTHLVSVAVGYGLGASIPTGWIALVAAIAFLAFGAWTLRGDSLSEDEEAKAKRAGGSAVVAASVAFFLAELGDKTMLATITLAAQHGTLAGSIGIWAGSTVGMVAADGLAIVVGRQLGKRLPERAISIGAAVMFFVFGAWLLYEAVPQVWGEGAWGRAFDAVGHHGLGWAALVLGALAVGTGAWFRGRAHRARGERRLDVTRTPGSPAWWARTLFAVAAVLGFGAPLLVALDVLQPISVLARPAVAVVGAGLLLLGFAVVAVALLQLGTTWRRSATEAGAAAAGDPEAARRPVLATDGIHRRVRNPALTGLIVGCAGMLFMAPTLLGVLAGVLILVAVQIQARAVYEPGLGGALGAEYDEYRRRTGRFLPRVRAERATSGEVDRTTVG